MQQELDVNTQSNRCGKFMNELKGTITKPPELPFTFGEYVDLIGGRSWQHLSSEVFKGGDQRRLSQIKRYNSVMTGANLFLNSPNQPEKLLLEKLYLKVAVLLEVYLRVQDYRKITSTSFGEITETTFRVGMEPSHTLAPGFWSSFVAVDSHNRVNLVRGDIVDSFSASSAPMPTKDVDHHGLGILLLRAMIVNHKQGAIKINSLLSDIVNQIEEIVFTASSANRRSTTEGQFHTILNNNIFSINNLVYQPVSNLKTAGCEKFWNKLMLVALRLMSYGLFKKREGFETLLSDWLSLEASIVELGAIKSAIKAEMLYGSPSVDQNLHDVLYDLIGDKQWLQESLKSTSDSSISSLQGSARTDSERNILERQQQIRDLRSMITATTPTVSENTIRDKDDLNREPFFKRHNDSVDNASLKETAMQSMGMIDGKDNAH